MKSALLVLLCALLISANQDQENLSTFLEGVFDENGLPHPSDLNACFDETAATQTTAFLGDLFHSLARGSLSDYTSLSSKINAFGDSLDPQVKDCISNSPDATALGKAYGVDETTDTDALEKQLILYVTLHFLKVKGWFKTADSQWSTGKYYECGHDLAHNLHSALSAKFELVQVSENDYLIVQPLRDTPEKQHNLEALQGVFDQNKFGQVQELNQCGDDDTHKAIFDFVGPLLHRLATASLTDYYSIAKDAENFANSLPQDFQDCVNGTNEINVLKEAYGIDDSTTSEAIISRIIKYATLHYRTVHGWSVQADDDWNNKQNYHQTGFEGAGWLHILLGH